MPLAFGPLRFDPERAVAPVTARAKGLGYAMARRLVDAGADVFIVARHEDEFEPATPRTSRPERRVAAATTSPTSSTVRRPRESS